MDLSAEQEYCLKSCLLGLAVESEISALGANSTEQQLLENTVLLSLLYRDLVLRCPLFIKKPGALPELQRLLAQYAKLNAFSKKAMHSDSGYFNGFLAGLLSVGFLTPRERRCSEEADRRLASTSIETVPDGSAEPTDTVANSAEADDNEDGLHVSSAVKEGLQIIVRDMVKHGGAERLFEIVRNASAIDLLPAAYRAVMHGLTDSMLPRIQQEMADPKKVSRASTFYTLCPRRAIYGLLNMSNPLKRVSGLLNLFLARPFGARSLLQRMFESIVELPKTENQIYDVKQGLPPTYVSHVERWVSEAYDPDPSRGDYEDDEGDAEATRELTAAEREKYAELARKVLLWRPAGEAAAAPVAEEAADPGWVVSLTNYYLSGWIGAAPADYPSEDEVMSLSQDELCAVHRLISLEMRLKDKTKFVEIVGDEQLVSLMKSGIPILCEPFVEIYEHSGMADMVMALFEFINSIVQVSKQAGDDADERRRGFHDACRGLGEALYQFNRNVVVNDTSTLKDLIDWGFNFCEKVGEFSLDLDELLRPLSGSNLAAVKSELDQVRAWRKRCDQASRDDAEFNEQQPATPAIAQLLLPPTLAMVRRVVPRYVADGTGNDGSDDDDVGRLASEFAMM
eukprot:TRINITY_DN2118_c0_g1_i1.p1 TRINITY_DN2118_c0_g1~~TRINITY_DN2118_c0_g1_i1.p1  ORF type:complete len:625 (-),score=163.57 TRINITY_DN2118_c0_g1_i1:554-2428(-)